jgi:hypothetical protein
MADDFTQTLSFSNGPDLVLRSDAGDTTVVELSVGSSSVFLNGDAITTLQGYLNEATGYLIANSPGPHPHHPPVGN